MDSTIKEIECKIAQYEENLETCKTYTEYRGTQIVLEELKKLLEYFKEL